MKLSKEYVTDFEALTEQEMASMVTEAKSFSIDEFLERNPKLKIALIKILEVVILIPFIGKGWKAVCLILLAALKSN